MIDLSNFLHAVYLDAEYRTMKDYVFKAMKARAIARYQGKSWRGEETDGLYDMGKTLLGHAPFTDIEVDENTDPLTGESSGDDTLH